MITPPSDSLEARYKGVVESKAFSISSLSLIDGEVCPLPQISPKGSLYLFPVRVRNSCLLFDMSKCFVVHHGPDEHKAHVCVGEVAVELIISIDPYWKDVGFQVF